MQFYTGLHQPSDAKHFDRCMISINRLWTRQAPIPGTGEIMLDSGAFTELLNYGRYRTPIKYYAAGVLRVHKLLGARLVAASTRDYMCEPFILARTGLTIPVHQQLTLKSYDRLRSLLPSDIYVLPVLQGYQPQEYVAHLRQYGERLAPGAWVGVGSVCKRNSKLELIEQVLMAIHTERPDLRLHGFGVKTTALESSIVRECLYSADSMAWSFAARKAGANANDWREADAFRRRIDNQRIKPRGYQLPLM